jgi:hypothetical protein
MGCTPTESFLASTLECFYNSSCIDLFQQQINYTNSINGTYMSALVFTNSSQFPTNTTIIDIVNALFIENWSTKINYAAYFDQCLPTSCSYTYIQQLNSFYTVTLLLGVYGGLSIILKWICPNIIYFMAKVYYRRKKRPNLVGPDHHTCEMATIETDDATPNSTDVDKSNVDSESSSTALVPKYTIFSHFRWNLQLFLIFLGLVFVWQCYAWSSLAS